MCNLLYKKFGICLELAFTIIYFVDLQIIFID
jgi:hypothetical protein